MDLTMAPKDEKTKQSTSNRRSRRKSWLCLAWIFGFLLLVVVLVVILVSTVFKPKHPVTAINSINVKGLKVSLGPALRVDLNLTLNLDISVKNPNRAGFKYGNSSALLYYRGEVVGEAAIPPGNISPEGTAEMNTTVTVLADRLLYDSNFYSDVISGTLAFSTYTIISGRVNILNLFKHHLVSYTSCNVTVNLSNRSVNDSECRYKTKL
ncbi:uncharacterized protein LOC122656288 [Telopea speciosissima]|uniref:uncharacterized protein LOC122656288 n=1 Tax=Telopea speciosissima TaxID=54955 RepID=UPI001CC75D1E|nr:uncharacterized protein LOC122656288 [Telopea speciosissima]